MSNCNEIKTFVGSLAERVSDMEMGLQRKIEELDRKIELLKSVQKRPAHQWGCDCDLCREIGGMS